MNRRPAPSEIGKAYVRVLGRRLGRFVEFEFFLNDEDLCVELVMPDAAFQEFCESYNAEVLPSKAPTGEESGAMERAPGLYRAPPKDTVQ